MSRRLRKAPQVFICLLGACLAAFLHTQKVLGQDTAELATDAPLIAGYFEFPPYMFETEGERSGFIVDMAEELGRELGLDVVFRFSPDAASFVDALIAGESHVVPGIGMLPSLPQTNLFSDPIAREALRLMVRAEGRTDLEGSEFHGLRIAIVPPTVGSDIDALLQRNVAVEFSSTEQAIIHLMIGDVDAVLTPNPTVFEIARQAGLDHRLRFLDPPIQEFDRVVSVHESRADLLPAINAAIARMETDGRLAALRERYFLVLPEPPPDILRVGVFDLPPHMSFAADGTPTGFAVEALRDIADLAGLQISFEPIAMSDLIPGETHDMLPILSITEDRRALTDFAYPLQSSTFTIFTRAGMSDGIQGLADLGGRTVGVLDGSLVNRLAQEAGLTEIVRFSGDDELPNMLTSLVVGEIDAVLFETQNVRRAIAELDLVGQIDEVAPPFFVSERAIALRPGLGEVRERLNAVIPAYLISEDFSALRETWFGDPPFWTPQRRLSLLAGLLAVIVAMGAIAVTLVRREKRRTQRATYNMLDAVVSNMSNQVILLGADNRILYTNSNRSLQEAGWSPEVRATGSDFAEAIKALVARDFIQMEGKTKAETEQSLLAIRGTHGAEIEYTSDGRTYRRENWLLPDDMVLLVRDDITTYRQQLDRIRQLNEDLSRQVAATDSANSELRSFAYATSHDLKAPANTLRMLIDALTEDAAAKLTPDERELLDEISNSTDRMRNLIEDVLDYTTTIGDQIPLEQVDLNAILDETLGNLKAEIAESGARIERDDLPTITANPLQMRMLMQNLVSNAIKFRSEDRSPVTTISLLDSDANRVRFSVADNGIGIPETHQAEIFRLFSRLNSSHRYSGTGLGLAVCQRVAQNHSGAISVASVEGKGTTFTVDIASGSHD